MSAQEHNLQPTPLAADSDAAASLERNAIKHAKREIVIGYLCGAGLLLIWTSFIVMTRLGVSAGFNPMDMSALRFAFAFLVMAPIALRYGVFGIPILRVLILAFFGGLGMSLFAFHALKFGTAAHGGVLMPGLLPLWAAILAWGLLSQRPRPQQWLGLGLTILGGGALTLESFREIETGAWRGDLLFPCASFSWAIFGTLVRRWGIATLPAANAVAIGSALLFLPYWSLTTDGVMFDSPWPTLIAWGVFQGVFASVISMLLYNRAIEALGPVRPALITSLVPGCVAVSAIPILGEQLGPLQIVGLLVTMAGMVIALYAPSRRAPR
jgi:drug/metabolite transporter (DMT)-like permease